MKDLLFARVLLLEIAKGMSEVTLTTHFIFNPLYMKKYKNCLFCSWFNHRYGDFPPLN